MSQVNDDRIIGGRYARKGEFPYVVSISHRPLASSCSGGILSPWYVMTACHCTSVVIDPFGGLLNQVTGDYSNTRVIAGTLARDFPHDQGYQLRWVFRWIQHPKCEPRLTGEWIFDVAIIQVTARFFFNELVRPLTILPRLFSLKHFVKISQVVQRTCIITGWGFTAVTEEKQYVNASRYLKALATRLLPPFHCNKLLCEYSRFDGCLNDLALESPDRMCAVAQHPNAGTICSGDSGSPLVCGGVAVGLVSYSSSCNHVNDPVVYARIDKSYDFISKYYIHSPDYVDE
ncbi:hypothetical protein GE061_011657 [Apolygus lucorum]|uniref:Uncharacterized protein n=1 Tax=Apolygus lucorum TaxID=248454 RepID=A0A6A4JWE2_APOLU|nr:hypothetical protein GE061_011657 [Apolygus lucorum]